MPHPNLEPAIPNAVEPWRQNLRGEQDALLRGPRADWWWTGLAPASCPGLQADGSLTALPQPNLATCTRESVLAAFDNCWTLTEVLFAGLQGEEAFFRPPYHHLRHPMLFYYCHPAALYINKLRVAGLIDNPLNPYFERIFETGVDEMRWDDMSKNEMLWPSFGEAHSYRQQVYITVRQLIETHPDLADGHAPITQSHPLWALFMGFDHERIHLETSSVLIRELPLELVGRPAAWPALHPSAQTGASAAFPPRAGQDYPQTRLLDISASQVKIGKPANWPSFGWDNEYGERRASVQGFRVDNQLVSNGAFLEFIQSGGYLEQQWWSEAGWEWRGFRNSKWPCFWVPEGPAGLHQYRLRTLFETIAMPWNWPAEVNAHEAAAFCAWRSARDGVPCRLPTEAEHHALRDAAWADTNPPFHVDGATLGRESGWNSQLAHGSPWPVDAGRPSLAGAHDVFGNLWQWHGDDFNPLPGSKVHPLYDDFSTPCYDGQHQMILGGSWISCGDEAGVWARFHFRPHFYQHAGFRVVQAAHDGGVVKLNAADAGRQVYEDEKMVDDYMLLHHGEPQTQMPWPGGPQRTTAFPQRCADWLLDGAKSWSTGTARALDIGCAVGGSSFELARGYGEVLGVDLSRAFIDAANVLQKDGTRPFFRRDEGDLGQTITARIDPSIARSRVSFRQADACSLPAELVDFDAVLMANLLCRLPSPKSLLGRLGGERGLVKVGGLLALFSPYSWLAQFTPKEAWLGGFEQDGQPVKSSDALKAYLQDEGFVLLREEEVPLVIREHARKYQFIVTHGMLWQRAR
ncbi:5-histidylcysteine sulfoxide synthase [Zoogloea oleivorans]|uniref:5-histidylcysteine sulfoxide synthase n=2 Tax=Zoogloea TaxID=349 RepID=A0A6C2D415_9RHOO|nr:5-histidylcysteine sulfoxide synthase [Zoogloea oleivorans]TYC61190.1 5-histidylcysteine sulfoxide synthase [Zoogloea oleivorans]